MFSAHESQRLALMFRLQAAAESARRRRALAGYVCKHKEVPDRLDELVTPSAIAFALKAAWEEGAFDGASVLALDAVTRFVSAHGGNRMPAFEFWTRPQYLVAEEAAPPVLEPAAPATGVPFTDLDSDDDDDDDGDAVVAAPADVMGGAMEYPASDDSDSEAREFTAAALKQIAAKADKRKRIAEGLESDDDVGGAAEEDSEDEEVVPAEEEACVASSAPPDVAFVSSSGGGDSGTVAACPSSPPVDSVVAHVVDMADSPAPSRRPSRAPSASSRLSSIDHAADSSPHRSLRRNHNVAGRAHPGSRAAPGVNTSHGMLSDDDDDDNNDDAVTRPLGSDSQSQSQLQEPRSQPLLAGPRSPASTGKSPPAAPASTGKRRRQASNLGSSAAAPVPPRVVAEVHAVAGGVAAPLSLDSGSEDVPASADPAPADASGPAAGTRRKADSPQKPKKQSSLLSLFKPAGGQALRSNPGASAAPAPSGSKKARK